MVQCTCLCIKDSSYEGMVPFISFWFENRSDVGIVQFKCLWIENRLDVGLVQFTCVLFESSVYVDGGMVHFTVLLNSSQSYISLFQHRNKYVSKERTSFPPFYAGSIYEAFCCMLCVCIATLIYDYHSTI